MENKTIQVRSLDAIGYPGYAIREDGWLINPKGRLIGGNLNGQVCLPGEPGRKDWKPIAWLVAKAFVPQPKGFNYVRHIDGDKFNRHYKNLEWSLTSSSGGGQIHAQVLQLLREGKEVEEISGILTCSKAYVRKIAAARLRELQLLSDFNQ